MYDKTVRRRRAVLGLLVACSLILLTAYFGEPSGGALHSIQRGLMSVVSPIQEGSSRALKPVRDLFGWVGDTVSAKGDLKQARKDRDRWQAEAIRNEAAVRENDAFRGLLALDRAPKDLTSYGPVTARVTGQSPTIWYSRIYINKGTSSGIAKDQPVIAADGSGEGNGLIGKVETAGSGSAVVQLITDAAVEVSARRADGGSSGLVHPRVGNPRDLILDDLAKTDPIAQGDAIVTAGTTSSTNDFDSIFPPDLPIGRVTRIDEAGTEQQEVHLKPFVDLRHVEFVQVLTKKVDHNR
jgi:rod shape-determining protein MreC